MFSNDPNRSAFKKVKAQKEQTEEERLEELKWEESAKAIAEKVQRQQEGLESAMIADEHKDENFQTMDDMKELLSGQVDAMFKAKSGGYRERGILGSISSVMSSGISGEKAVDKEANERIGLWFVERAKYIPLRLSLDERKYLRLVSSVFRASDYTDLVDGVAFSTPHKRLHRQIQCISALLASTTVALDYEIGLKAIKEKNFNEYCEQFSQIFELSRRYKIMNPEKLRGTYGKLMYFLQDSNLGDVKEALGIDLSRKIRTVYEVLSEAGAEDLLKSQWISSATRELTADGRTRNQINKERKHKELGIETLAKQYRNDKISGEQIRQCLYSLGDNSNFLVHNVEPVEEMINLLKEYFSPEALCTAKTDKWSLALTGEKDKDGSRLTHSHERQFCYVLQSLTLWREILHDMFRLWSLAEQDLLDESLEYKIRNTGQGLHRVQQAPRTLRAIHGILYAVQQKLGKQAEGWVGSSVIHLGDTNVPNAFMFIDKYNQVPRILNPIVHCLRSLDSVVAKDKGLLDYVEHAYGSVEDCKKTILSSFFREGFDGSGGDNFFEAGSCIDGRLTSAWNWCQRLPSKDFFYLFKLSGFLGFDGNFQS